MFDESIVRIKMKRKLKMIGLATLKSIQMEMLFNLMFITIENLLIN